MRPLTSAELLEVWERGWLLSPAHQALLLLGAAWPEQDAATLPVGRRDAALLTLRAWTFGDPLTGAAECPECGVTMVIETDGDALRTPVPEEVDAVVVDRDGFRASFRLPTTADLLDATDADDLLARCLLESSGEPPEMVTEVVAELMEAADPQANVTLALRCEACAAEWAAAFDVVSFFWAELDRWARRTLREVHALASAYGWREGEILAMSPVRRAAYLGMVRG